MTSAAVHSVRSLRTPGLLLVIALAPVGALAQTPDLVGDWSGALEVAGTRLPIVFHITADDEGYAATMDSPNQGAFGIPAGRPSVEGDRVTIAVAAVGGSWTGTVAGDTLAGEWTQGGQALPLVLVRGGPAAPPPPARPQHPEPPFPYDVEEVRYPVPGTDVELAGTLTLPPGGGPVAAALLITGSGPQNRDEEVMGHRVFAVLADALTRAGIAVLRVDDRGVGESTGDFSAATSDDFARDAAAGVAFLKEHARVDPQAVGLVGHSEGGLVAPMVAAEVETAFSVLLAGPAVNGEEVLVAQTAHMQRAQGVPPAQVEANRTAIRAVARILRERPREVWADEVREALMAAVPAGVPEAQAAQVRAAVDGQVQSFATPWMARFVAYDPRPALEALDGPVLALFGALDAQVLPSQNLTPMREALADNPEATVEVLDGLNHLFQPAESGLPTEYAQIETTVDPAALDRVARWILAVTR
ncbi:alpha/beta fold hydrolase [Gaopeijia maritima]|uniref:alpha/beta hydrolase family protein n=1 Tax=Gaopeijia maritima TaxID=3119007 RepID=UPI00324592F5